MMWGDVERAISLDLSDPLVSLLFQVTGPAHIPWEDPVWEELLHGYNVWVHMEASGSSSDDDDDIHLTSSTTQHHAHKQHQHGGSSSNFSGTTIIMRACQLTQQHSARTSNLAALTIHITQMVQNLTKLVIETIEQSTMAASSSPIQTHYNNHTNSRSKNHSNNSQPDRNVNNDNNNNTASIAAFSNRISLVGKSRAVAGSLNLLRILAHATLQQHNNNSRRLDVSSDDATDLIRESFTYRSRESGGTVGIGIRRQQQAKTKHGGGSDANSNGFDVGGDLISSLFDFLQCSYSILPSTSNDIPELYDVVVLTLQLLIVLLSTQLYQPMISSFQKRSNQQNNDSVSSTNNLGYFWHVLFQQAKDQSSKRTSEMTSSSCWTVHQILLVFLQWKIHRPVSPLKSIQYHRTAITQQVVSMMTNTNKNTNANHHHYTNNNNYNNLGTDGLYEGYSIVQACAPKSSSYYNGTSNNDTDGLDSSLGSSRNGIRKNVTPSSPSGLHDHQYSHYHYYNQHHVTHSSSDSLLGATRGVLELSSTLLLLPMRLLNLAIGLLSIGGGHHSNERSIQQMQLQKIKSQQQQDQSRNRTKDILWLTESPIADLAVCLLLLLSNNERAEEEDHNKKKHSTNNCDPPHSSNNPFRDELKRLVDNRWDKPNSNNAISNDVAHLQSISMNGVTKTVPDDSRNSNGKGTVQYDDTLNQLKVNFEALFLSFGSTAHNEVGALLLYTLLQSSPTFAEFIAVRSDLDAIVLPLLRTLYFATSLRYFVSPVTSTTNTPRKNKSSSLTTNKTNQRTINQSGRNASSHSLLHRVESRENFDQQESGNIPSRASTDVSKQNYPFRSQSQLYVIVILLLLLSQDTSFGTDAFRRIHIPTLPWYKERHLKNINLGSVLVLSICRCLVFNLNRLNDPFLLSNCCAVLMNLAPSVVELQDYAAMRLVSVTVSFMKRYITLRKQHPVGYEENDENMLSSLAQHGEVSRTLLRFIKLGLSVKNIDKNIHLIYALVYHYADFERQFADKGCPFKKSEILRLQTIAATGAKIIEGGHESYTAVKALKLLTENIDKLRDIVIKQEESAGSGRRFKSKTDGSTDDFMFMYEEEADPEIFFVPYVWDVIVCTVTASTIEWNKNRIQVFPLLELDPMFEDDIDDDEASSADNSLHESVIPQFARDVSDIV